MIISCFLDLHVLVNTIHAPSIINSSASASWLPICLPKFNPSAFVNAYVMFMRKTSDELKPSTSISSRVSSEPTSTSGSRAPSIIVTDQTSPPLPSPTPPSPPSSTAEVGLICVSGAADFEAVRDWCNTVSEVRHISYTFEIPPGTSFIENF